MGTIRERLRGYRDMKGPKGASRDKANLDYWAERASENSNNAHRATNKEIEVPATDEAGASTGIGRLEHSHEMAKKERRHLGSGFQAGTRRTTD